MTNYSSSFNVQEYELRGYTNPYLTSKQTTEVQKVETRVNDQLDFLAQMLGWQGPNYWTNLTSTVSQKRQLLGGSYGVYNSFTVLRILSVQNWENTILVEKVENLSSSPTVFFDRGSDGFDEYVVKSFTPTEDGILLGFSVLPDRFYENISNNYPLLADIRQNRPSPFYRPTVGVSGDAAFNVVATSTGIELYPLYDTAGLFPCAPILIRGSTYYFNQCVYFAESNPNTPTVYSTYSEDLGLWFLPIPENSGVTGYVVWSYSGSGTNLSKNVRLSQWKDPSDWNERNTLANFIGTWGNKGGPLPFNFVFDSLSVHGFDERVSVFLAPFTRTLPFDQIIELIYSQIAEVGDLPPFPQRGRLWFNNETGALSANVTGDLCEGSWVEVDYRNQPQEPLVANIYPTSAAFSAVESSLPLGTTVNVVDCSGLDALLGSKIIGLFPGASFTNASAVLYSVSINGSTWWRPYSFSFADVPSFSADNTFLPVGVPVSILDATSLSSVLVSNLPITITDSYRVVLLKDAVGGMWRQVPDSVLEFIADSGLEGGPIEGQLWWDYSSTPPFSRSARVFYDGVWVDVNTQSSATVSNPIQNMGVLLFYCDGNLLTPGETFGTNDFSLTFVENTATWDYEFFYEPKTFRGSAQLPTITVSDSNTTAYRADVTSLVFSGLQYRVSPNVLNSLTTLRLWRPELLEVVEDVTQLERQTYLNPLRADINNGPSLENWEKFFVRLPLEYQRNGNAWQKVALTCQDFSYWGSSVAVEEMECPPQDEVPAIYEELVLYPQEVRDFTYVYSEPYLYSNIAIANPGVMGEYDNSGVFPEFDEEFDEFTEATLIDYEPLHERQADVSSPVNKGYGDWFGMYVNLSQCAVLSGYLTTDLETGAVTPVEPPVWDTSVYKFAPTCEFSPASYDVDANIFKVGYAYFIADASAAEDGFFDVSQESSWRYPETLPRTLYVTSR